MKNMKKSAMILFVLMVISKVLGILRESFLSYHYADGMYAVAYIQASRIPNIVFGMIAAGLVSTFIPMYSRVVHNEGEDQARKFMNNTLTIVFFLTLGLLVLGLLFTEELVRINGLGLSGETFQVTVDFTRIALFTLLTNGVFSIFSGYHQYEGRFYVAPVTGFFLNIIVITSIIVSSKTSPIVMAYGLVLAALAQLVFAVLIAVFKGKYRYSFSLDFKDKYFKPMMVMAAPIILGQSVQQINNTIDMSIASLINQNAVATINYAVKISDSIFTLFVGSITTVMYPTIIKQASKKEYDDLKTTIVEVMNFVSLIVIPSTIGILVLAGPVVNVFYNRGMSADPVLLNSIKYALVGATVGLFAVSIKDVLTRTYYSLNDTKTPVIISVITVALNLVLNIILGRIWGVPGLTLATSIAGTIGMLVMYLMLNKKMQGLKTRKFLNSTIRITISSLLMGAVVFVMYQILLRTSMHSLIILGLSVGFGVIVYAGGLIVLKVEEFTDLLDIVKVKLKIGSNKN